MLVVVVGSIVVGARDRSNVIGGIAEPIAVAGQPAVGDCVAAVDRQDEPNEFSNDVAVPSGRTSSCADPHVGEVVSVTSSGTMFPIAGSGGFIHYQTSFLFRRGPILRWTVTFRYRGERAMDAGRRGCGRSDRAGRPAAPGRAGLGGLHRFCPVGAATGERFETVWPSLSAAEASPSANRPRRPTRRSSCAISRTGSRYSGPSSRS